METADRIDEKIARYNDSEKSYLDWYRLDKGLEYMSETALEEDCADDIRILRDAVYYLGTM